MTSEELHRCRPPESPVVTEARAIGRRSGWVIPTDLDDHYGSQICDALKTDVAELEDLPPPKNSPITVLVVYLVRLWWSKRPWARSD